MRLFLLAALGGAFGAGSRHLVNVAFLRWFGAGFPWATLFENVSGSLLMGIFLEMITRRFDAAPDLRALLMTGVLGGFTTFSAFSLDAANLMNRGAMGLSVMYVVASVAVSIAALYAGLVVGRAIFA